MVNIEETPINRQARVRTPALRRNFMLGFVFEPPSDVKSQPERKRFWGKSCHMEVKHYGVKVRFFEQ